MTHHTPAGSPRALDRSDARVRHDEGLRGALRGFVDRVRSGDLSVRVEEGTSDDEVTTLSRAFNRMTNQLAGQRNELMEAYRQIEISASLWRESSPTVW